MILFPKKTVINTFVLTRYPSFYRAHGGCLDQKQYVGTIIVIVESSIPGVQSCVHNGIHVSTACLVNTEYSR